MDMASAVAEMGPMDLTYVSLFHTNSREDKVGKETTFLKRCKQIQQDKALGLGVSNLDICVLRGMLYNWTAQQWD